MKRTALASIMLASLLVLLVCDGSLTAAQPAQPQRPKKTTRQTVPVPPPTLTAVPYGEHDRHILDFWKADSSEPTPLVCVIHGGGFNAFLEKRESILPWIAEYSPYALVTADDPPVYLFYSAPPALGQDQRDPTHTSNFGVKLQEECESAGVACELVYPGAPDVKHETTSEYLMDRPKK